MAEDTGKGRRRDLMSTGAALDVYQRLDSGDGERLTGRILGQYQVDALIGEGGMSQVWSAHRIDGRFDRQVAIKMSVNSSLSAALRERFLLEQSLLAELNHPNIAQLYDAGVTQEGWPYIVMEYVEGEPIDSYCDARRLSLQARLELFLALCDAVQFAHRRLIVHRDIKPGNILVTPDDQPKLLDFGIAKLLEADLETEDPARTALADRMLTPLYASPEQILREQVSTATDVYALGLLLYELLTGRRARKIDSQRPSELEKVACETLPVLPSLVVMTDTGNSRGRAGSEEHLPQGRGQDPAARSPGSAPATIPPGSRVSRRSGTAAT